MKAARGAKKLDPALAQGLPAAWPLWLNRELDALGAW